MTSGGFLIPLFPGTRRKQIFRSVRPPSALCRLIRFYMGDCSTDEDLPAEPKSSVSERLNGHYAKTPGTAVPGV